MVCMQFNLPTLWVPRLSAFGVAALLAASTAYWVLRQPTEHLAESLLPDTAGAAAVEAVPASELMLLARLLGSEKADAMNMTPSGLAGRVVLSGVVASAAGGGAALISIDGKPAKAFRVGARVTDELVLQSVTPHRALLAAQGEATTGLTLDLKRPAQ